MAGKRATLMATDPPYLVNYDGGNRPQSWGKDGRRISAETKTKHWDDYVDEQSSQAFYHSFLKAALGEALTCRPTIYQWFAMMRAPLIYGAWQAAGLLAHQVLIWHKSRKVLGRCDYLWDYEPVLYGWVKGSRPPARRRPPVGACAVWCIDSAIEDGVSGIHPTQKPVELFRRPIGAHTLPGEIIYEPFCGSGTALIAAELEGRACYGLELAPAFADCAVARWERFTGQKARREG